MHANPRHFTRPLTLGISLGDPTGIGPEITIKAIQAESADNATRYVVVGDPSQIEVWCDRLKFRGRWVEASIASPEDRLVYRDAGQPPLSPTIRAGAPEAAEAALASLAMTAELCLKGELDGMITAPLSKEAILRTGRPFIGQTEFLTALAGNPKTAMMLLGHDEQERWLRVVLVTTHLPIHAVAQAITPERISQAVRLATTACTDLNLPRTRVAVCGLNPHAGEGGMLGDEELRIIRPTLDQLRNEGCDVVGPLSGDTVFHAAVAEGQFDVVVAMYHDQGLAPLKLLAFNSGVNWTLGLPFIRTSPDHGTAYDLAGQGIADPSSMRSAIRLARQLSCTSHRK